MVDSRVVLALLQHPTSDQLLAFLREHLRVGGRLLQVVSECEVLYSGRAASLADAGDYLVILKADGSLQVHDHQGVRPINWQPRTDDLHLSLEDGQAVLTVERFRPPEAVRIVFLEPALVQALHLREPSGFSLLGSEEQMQALLADNLGLLEEGLELIDRELPIATGGIDLYARDSRGRLVIIELKRGKATQEAVHQLQRYVEQVRGEGIGEVRGILVAPGLTAPARARLERLGLEYREVPAFPTAEATEVQPPLFEGLGEKPRPQATSRAGTAAAKVRPRGHPAPSPHREASRDGEAARDRATPDRPAPAG